MSTKIEEVTLRDYENMRPDTSGLTEMAANAVSRGFASGVLSLPAMPTGDRYRFIMVRDLESVDPRTPNAVMSGIRFTEPELRYIHEKNPTILSSFPFVRSETEGEYLLYLEIRPVEEGGESDATTAAYAMVLDINALIAEFRRSLN
jgi:hypothetical protein